jgi:RNA polymerase subunit RPABC4/transcription elongation factor Spt4
VERCKILGGGDNMTTIKCPECGYEVTNDVNMCPKCGHEIAESKIKGNIFAINKKNIGILLCIVACACFFVSYKQINNDKYIFYKQHYKECMQGYRKSKTQKNSYGNASLFYNAYNSIASSYEKMAEDDEAKIQVYRIQAAVWCIGGIVCMVIGISQYRQGTRNENGKMSKSD